MLVKAKPWKKAEILMTSHPRMRWGKEGIVVGMVRSQGTEDHLSKSIHRKLLYLNLLVLKYTWILTYNATFCLSEINLFFFLRAKVCLEKWKIKIEETFFVFWWLRPQISDSKINGIWMCKVEKGRLNYPTLHLNLL